MATIPSYNETKRYAYEIRPHESDYGVSLRCKMIDYVFSSINYVAKIVFFCDTSKNEGRKFYFY